jgi:hypothetical protein
MLKNYKILSWFLLAALVLNTLATSNILLFTKENNQNKFSELSEILGENVIICSNSNAQKYYISSFIRLDAEQQQHFQKLDDIKKNISSNQDQFIENKFYVALNIADINKFSVSSESAPEKFYSFHKSSRAPPVIS